MAVAEQLGDIKKNLPQSVKLVAVSKTKPVELIMEAYNSGHKVFGENKAQELQKKSEMLPKDIEWHFIGHLQTNKVKYIAPFVSLIHGVDSLKLLKVIDKEGQKNNHVLDCLLQFHIAREETKFGLDLEEAYEMLCSEEFKELKHVRITGVMGMATFTDDSNQVEAEFEELREIFLKIKKEYFAGVDSFREISMGMSDDFELAVKHGSTIVRIGSKIFGSRK